ncbi:hypothetical protein [Streptomyces sp. NPDC057336]|uniref:hypothetical protein n=1 Tax=Streptomyces sp. NPDC057336 TaxID=3346102 RepID=UPI00362D6FE7
MTAAKSDGKDRRTRRYDEVVPDAHVTLASTGDPCVVLHKLAAPADVSPTAVFVFSHVDGSTTWRDAETSAPPPPCRCSQSCVRCRTE